MIKRTTFHPLFHFEGLLFEKKMLFQIETIGLIIEISSDEKLCDASFCFQCHFIEVDLFLIKLALTYN